jgi:hypothetical protein
LLCLRIDQTIGTAATVINSHIVVLRSSADRLTTLPLLTVLLHILTEQTLPNCIIEILPFLAWQTFQLIFIPVIGQITLQTLRAVVERSLSRALALFGLWVVRRVTLAD